MKHDTDKYASGLIAQYEKMFDLARYLPVKYLEVGVYMGGSLCWASDFFAHVNTEIYGVDYKLYPDAEFPARAVVRVADQRDEKSMKAVGIKHGPFDIIVDDGCHFPLETACTFSALWPFVRPGGVYIIEDFGAAYTHVQKEGRYEGMDALVLNLIEWKEKHGIDGFQIVHNVNGKSGSFAAFWKKKGE